MTKTDDRNLSLNRGPAAEREEEPVQTTVAGTQDTAFWAPGGTLAGPLGWARENLFSSPANTALTLISVFFLAWAIPPLVDWAFISALFSGTSDDCRANDGGACWALIGEKHRLILFGIYPFDEHWRPLLATALFISMGAVTAWPRMWRWWLVPIWIVTLVVLAILMWGGVFGLTYVDNTRWGGLPLTLLLSVGGIVLAFPLSVLLALGRQSNLPAIKAICVGFIELIRGVPLVSLLFMASVMFPLFLPDGVNVDKLLRALVGITIFTAAYLAEAIRGGLQAIPSGQYEAAEALGLSYWKKTLLIILPQALRIVIPPMVNQFISCFKDTSLVTIIGLYDLLTSAKVALADPPWRAFYVESYAFTALIYWAFCYFMSRYSQFLERDLNAGITRR